MGRGEYRLFQKVNMSCNPQDECPHKKNKNCPIHFFDDWAPRQAKNYIRHGFKLKRNERSTSSNRWEKPDSGYYDDAISQALVILYEKKEVIQSAKYPRACAHYELRKLKQTFSKFKSSGWNLSEWDQRQLTKARSEVDSSHPNADEGERDRLVRERYINNGGNPSVFDTIYGQPLRLWDVELDDDIDMGPTSIVEVGTQWLIDKDAPTPEEEVVGQLSFMDFLEEECDETQRDFLELCAGRTDTEVSEILHENVSSTNRRKRKLFEEYKSWIRAAGEKNS